jgi:alkanesulfonate monooxygenase SsuD/methylene tetrahydromethanopterin reductase-like flavin-dependent oxidoreductase (luciferase family)
MLEEAVQICRGMFRGERPTIAGAHFHTNDAINSPLPVRQGGPPIMIGGTGEQRTIPLVARYADMWNCNADFDELPRKLDVLAQECDKIGRDPRAISTTPLVFLLVADTMEAAVAKRNAFLARRGIDWDALPEPVQRNISARLVLGDADAVGEHVGRLLALGMDGIVFNMPADGWELDAVARAGEVLSKAIA